MDAISRGSPRGREPQPAPIYAETQYPATFGWSELASMRMASTKLITAPSPELYDLRPRSRRNSQRA